MTAIEIAKRLVQLGQTKDACNAYALALQTDGALPGERLEAACYLLEHGGDSRVSMTCLIRLYQEGFFTEDIFRIVTRMFYQPNEPDFQRRYEGNCRLLSKYPYLFRKGFPSFQDLPVRFLPFGDKGGYVPFSPSEKRFDPFVNVNDTIISRNFFRDLEKPVLADDVYSQYELEYLRDNVRPSEHIGRENHIYLHYADWTIFCSWLQILDFKELLKKKQFVFLIGDDIERYPIDFKAAFGTDYSKYPVRRVRIREVKKLIWHSQLSAHNGGDFFNEVFDYHPNLYIYTSVMFKELLKNIDDHLEFLNHCSLQEALNRLQKWNDPQLIKELYKLKNRTPKDVLVAFFMFYTKRNGNLDSRSRIVPALFFQPHFSNIKEGFFSDNKTGDTVLETADLDVIRQSSVFTAFPYIKTFTPIRRFTSSYVSTLRFMDKDMQKEHEKTQAEREEFGTKIGIGHDVATAKVLNRTFMRDPEDRLYRDSVMVRFEDGKLNPKATFSKLAAFLDIPYTESMTYCSWQGKHDVETYEGNAIGFDPASVYKTYEEYAGKNECCYIEYLLRDAYRFYGYDFHYYDGAPVDEARYSEWINHFDVQDRVMRNAWNLVVNDVPENPYHVSGSQISEGFLENFLSQSREQRLAIARGLQRKLRFVNKNGQPLEMTPMLQPDPALLERPLYH